MLQLTNKPTRALALLFLPVVLVLACGPPLTPDSNRSELGPNVDLDHDGLPDNVELRSFNDRENFRRRFTWGAEMQFYNLSDHKH
jgi:hypothetical protein